ncbi:MAG: amino acid ABC transporter permease [Clostridiales bacterium]|nr:amino acid ABC transporter permease [Clostridiales bacterium]MDY3745671.1 amino acid ABC transporter permease [Lachnospiraceae bacterium]
MIETLKLVVQSFWPMVLAGIKYSIPMMLISFGLGLVLALLVALGRMSRFKILSSICAFYVWIIRGTPLLVQLFIIFYGLPSVGIVFTPFVSAILGLTISQGAYNSEVIRGALTGIPKGQHEAPQALGMTKFQTLIHVIIPQAALTAVPALGNSFISLLKDTSLTSVLTVQEIFMIAKQISAIKYKPLVLYIEAAFVYLLFSTFLTWAQHKVEKKLGKHLVEETE